MPLPGATARLVHNEVWSKLKTDDPGVQDATYRLLRFRPDGYAFMPRFKSGAWDGYISLYQRAGGTFPGGLLGRVSARLTELDVDVDIEDRSQLPLTASELAGGINLKELRPYQIEAADAAMAAKRGVFECATGTGKTEIMSEMIRRTACRSLIIVASRDLAWQTIERFAGSKREVQTLEFPNAPEHGLYGIVGDDHETPGLVTAALYQTLVRRLMPVCLRCDAQGELEQRTCNVKKGGKRCGGDLDFTETEYVREWLASFDAIHLDECHRGTAKTWWPVVNSCPAYWRFGYCLTPKTKVLTADLHWVPVGELSVGDMLVGFDEQPTYGNGRGGTKPRRLHPSAVVATGRSLQHCYRILLSDGTSLTATDEHPWLVYPYEKNQTLRWVTSQELFLQRGRHWRMPRYFPVWEKQHSRAAGYIAGVFDGEGSRKLRNGAMTGLSFTQKDNETWEDTLQALKNEGIHYTTPPHGDVKGLKVACVPFHPSMELLGSTRPRRLLGIWAASKWPSLYPCDKLDVVAVEDVGYHEVVNLSTSTQTYISEGFGSHNSATPFKSDPITELKLVGATGEIFYSFPAREAIDEGYLTEPFVATVDPNFPDMGDDEDTRYIDSYRDGIVEHVKRCRVIAEIAKGTSEGWDVPTLILVQWTEHGRNIKRALREIGVRAEFISGTAPTKKRQNVMHAMDDGRLNCVIATTIFDEGVNVPAIGALILAGGGKARHKVVQRIGRGLRVVEGKEYLAVFDIWDSHGDKYLVKHARQRLRAVKDAGYAQEMLTPKQVMARIKKGDLRG